MTKHKPDCELQRGEFIVYSEPIGLPSLSNVVAMTQGRLSRGELAANMMRTSRRRAVCRCEPAPSQSEESR